MGTEALACAQKLIISTTYIYVFVSLTTLY